MGWKYAQGLHGVNSTLICAHSRVIANVCKSISLKLGWETSKYLWFFIRVVHRVAISGCRLLTCETLQDIQSVESEIYEELASGTNILPSIDSRLLHLVLLLSVLIRVVIYILWAWASMLHFADVPLRHDVAATYKSLYYNSTICWYTYSITG